MVMVFGYVRVSTQDQNIDRQELAIKQYALDHGIVVNRLYVDRCSGKDFSREQYQAMKGSLREGDTLIVKELDRLGRNMGQLKQEWSDLKAMGVHVIVIDMPVLSQIDRSLDATLVGNIVFELLAYLAEKERRKLRERQAEGIAIAKARGVYKGRKPIVLDESRMRVLCKQWRNGERTAVSVQRELGLKSSTFYRKVKEMGL